MDANGHLCWWCYSTAECAFHKTTARRARGSAHADDLQHGIRLQHGAHGAVRIPGSDSTARCTTHGPQHCTHGAVRTPGSYSTAQCATAPQPLQATVRHARRSAHTGELQHRAAAPQRFKVHAQTRALQDIAGHGATTVGHNRNTWGAGTHHTHWHGHGALGAGRYSRPEMLRLQYLDPRGH
jgi:hypothetical protein